MRSVQWGMDHDARIGMARIISMTMQDEKKVQWGSQLPLLLSRASLGPSIT
jgi:hypothetical protein